MTQKNKKLKNIYRSLTFLSFYVIKAFMNTFSSSTEHFRKFLHQMALAEQSLHFIFNNKATLETMGIRFCKIKISNVCLIEKRLFCDFESRLRAIFVNLSPIFNIFCLALVINSLYGGGGGSILINTLI